MFLWAGHQPLYSSIIQKYRGTPAIKLQEDLQEKVKTDVAEGSVITTFCP